ncbi:unnamed protein product [Lymnaea stagnalis]|uniref:FAS1 domain-containing protein n=1 Tax=Lymnaea stagnalis TaxID=6523 RepID=A0AAV2H198_LYMST
MKTVFLCVAVIFLGAVTAQTAPSAWPDILAALKADGRFTVFADLLEDSDTLDRINTSSHFTVFAPTDAAFAKLPAGQLDALKADPDKLEEVLGHHVVLKSAINVNTQQDKNFKAANNQTVRINSYPIVHMNMLRLCVCVALVLVGAVGAQTDSTDIPETDSTTDDTDAPELGSTTVAPIYPYIIDALTSNGHFTVFLDLLESTDLLTRINASSHFTVFAPTDAAFARLPAGQLDALKADADKLEDLLSYHVVLNSAFNLHGIQQDTTLKTANNDYVRINTYSVVHTVTVDGVNITIKNIPVNHGYVNGIEKVLSQPMGTILDIASNRSDLTTFISLLGKANLNNFFTSDRSTTIFAPNNDAFAKLSQGTLDYLNTHTADLAEVLKFHMIKHYAFYSIGMKHTFSIDSSDQHKDILMILEDGSGGLAINHAKIVERDISSVNGVVHIVDSVLIPVRVQVAIADNGVVVG